MKYLSSHIGRAGLAAAFLISIFSLPLSRVGYAQSPVIQVGNVLFKAPSDWRRIEKDGAVLFMPSDSPADSAPCTLTIMPGQELDGDFKKWFETAIEQVRSGLQVISGGGVTTANLKEGYSVAWSIMIAEDAKGQRSYRFYLAAHPGNRAELITFVTTTQDAYDRY